ncbi:hypothetical protein AVEN_253531-1 [Araneus ventricosus]|uniref:Uncharacterized protein n=1 Tax=Araneus ventricosus TaxID=182803 RepID=A0A4Y2BSL6_ARAVE|nr:hypothetical protein AVEN_253531-1 [Araneus ventricosus]
MLSMVLRPFRNELWDGWRDLFASKYYKSLRLIPFWKPHESYFCSAPIILRHGQMTRKTSEPTVHLQTLYNTSGKTFDSGWFNVPMDREKYLWLGGIGSRTWKKDFVTRHCDSVRKEI